MNTLSECLQRIPGQPLDCIVHIGAGTGTVLETYATLSVAKLAMVEGDPETAQVLQQRVAGHAHVQAVGRAVSPHGEPLDWHRYTVRALNGPLATTGLQTYYPRLQPLETRPISSQSLAALVDELVPADTQKRACVLVLEVPGQEAALLASLGQQRLKRFSWVVLHGRNLDTGVGNTLATGIKDLADAGYVQITTLDHPPKVLWSYVLLQQDLRANALADLEATAAAQNQQLAALRLTLAQEQAARQASEQALTATQQRHLQTEAHLQQQTQQHRARAEDLARNLAEAQQQMTLLTKQRDEEAHWHRENAQWAQGLKVHNDRLRHEAEGAEAALAKVQAALAQQTLATKQAEEAAATQLASLAAERDQARLQHQQAAEGLQQRQQHVATLDATVASLREELEQSRACTQLAELGQAAAREEAAAETAKTVLLQQALATAQQALSQAQADAAEAAQQAAVQVAALSADRDQHRQWHLQNADLSKGLQQQCKTLESEVYSLGQQLAQAHQTMAAAQDRTAAVTQELQALQTAQAEAAASLDKLRADQATTLQQLALSENQAEQLRAQIDEQQALSRSQVDQLQARLVQVAQEAATAAEGAARAAAASAEHIDNLRKARDQEAHWHSENARWAQSLKAENEQMLPELQQLRAAQADLTKEAAEAKSKLQALQQAMTERDNRQRLMDMEILRAEAQLGLIKDVLIREKNF